MIVSIAHCKRNETQNESDKHYGHCAAEVSLANYFNQQMIWFDVKTLSHSQKEGQNRIGEDYHQENYEVDSAYAEE